MTGMLRRGSLVCFLAMPCALVSGERSDSKELPREFSRPTVQGRVLQSEPASHNLVYEDSLYAFRERHYGGKGEHVPAFVALRKADSAWIEITQLSTEHALLGRSPEVDDIPLAVGWDFSRLADSAYATLPLHTSGSIVFPDRITCDAARAIYRFDCNSLLDRPQCLTTFWVRRVDLDGIGVAVHD